MPRRKNTRPTFIYWLIDTRPETIAAGWSSGQPFYCGKTVKNVRKRLAQHKHSAVHKPHGNVSHFINLCGKDITIFVVGIVSPNGDWRSEERRWIRVLRDHFPNCVNVSDGGEGSPGWVPGPETIAKMKAASESRSKCPLYLARLSQSHKGHKRSKESVIAGANKMKEMWRTEQHREKMRLANLNKPPRSAESRAKARISNLGQKRSDETKSRIAISLLGKKRSEASRTKQSESLRAAWARRRAANV